MKYKIKKNSENYEFLHQIKIFYQKQILIFIIKNLVSSILYVKIKEEIMNHNFNTKKLLFYMNYKLTHLFMIMLLFYNK
jgi:hypothetical protein